MAGTEETQVGEGSREETGDSQEHIEQMVARAEGRDTGESADSGENQSDSGDQSEDGLERDENGLILGKYKSEADLAKGYKELQAAYTKLRQGEGSDDSEGEGEDESGDSDSGIGLNRDSDSDGSDESDSDDGDGEGEGEEDSGPIDLEKYTKSFVENGELTEEDYEELEKQGLSRDYVDLAIEGLKAKVERRRSAAAERVGGEERFNAVREWAGKNLSDSEFEHVNEQLKNAQTDEQVALIYETLATRYDREVGSEGEFVSSRRSSSGKAGYRSRKEMTEDMQSDKYKNDPAFRKEVEDRIANTDWL